jgi:hypothetical protein
MKIGMGCCIPPGNCRLVYSYEQTSGAAKTSHEMPGNRIRDPAGDIGLYRADRDRHLSNLPVYFCFYPL